MLWHLHGQCRLLRHVDDLPSQCAHRSRRHLSSSIRRRNQRYREVSAQPNMVTAVLTRHRPNPAGEPSGCVSANGHRSGKRKRGITLPARLVPVATELPGGLVAWHSRSPPHSASATSSSMCTPTSSAARGARRASDSRWTCSCSSSSGAGGWCLELISSRGSGETMSSSTSRRASHPIRKIRQALNGRPIRPDGFARADGTGQGLPLRGGRRRAARCRGTAGHAGGPAVREPERGPRPRSSS